MVPGSALFFKGEHYALRVEVPALGKEFTYGVYIGSDPEGYLYLNDVRNLSKPTQFIVSQVTNPLDQQACALIEFWYKDKSHEKAPYAVFLAADPTNAVTNTGFNGFKSVDNPDPYGGDPLWVDLKLAQVSATVEIDSEDTEATLTVDVIGKTAKWIVSNNFLPDTQTIMSKGTLSFKSLDGLTSDLGGVVNYGSDRLVFYKSKMYAKDFVAFFIPAEIRGIGDGDNTLGNVPDTEFSGVTWTKTST